MYEFSSGFAKDILAMITFREGHGDFLRHFQGDIFGQVGIVAFQFHIYRFHK